MRGTTHRERFNVVRNSSKRALSQIVETRMPTFEYQALNRAGDTVSGTVLGSSMEQALSSLSETGLIVERINQSALPPGPVGFQQTPIQGPPTAQRSYVATSVVGPVAGRVPLANL